MVSEAESKATHGKGILSILARISCGILSDHSNHKICSKMIKKYY